MSLTKDDVIRIRKAGFKTNSFLVSNRGQNFLKNNGGRCFFLSNNGCSIYKIRPEGCRVYPLIYDIKNNTTLLDNLCPHLEEYKVEKSDIDNLKNIYARVYGIDLKL